MLASLVVAACWMQPFAWLALFEMRRLRELAADNTVLLAGSNVFEYAETIHECAVDSTLQPANGWRRVRPLGGKNETPT